MVVPFNREGFLKVNQKIAFDTFWTIKCHDVRVGHVFTKAHGPKNLFEEAHPVANVEAIVALNK